MIRGRRIDVRWLAASLAFVAVAGVAACDDPVAPGTGAIRALVSPAGQDISTDELAVSVGASGRRVFDPGSLDLTIVGMPVGDHAVRLEGLAPNCEVVSANPRVVTVTPDDTTMAEFTMFCARRVGSVLVRTNTTGVELDPDGYVATVVDGPSQAIGINGTAIISNVREGHQTITLTGVAANCGIVGDRAPTAVVQFGATVAVDFFIECVRFGALEVTVSTAGVEPDADGYVIEARAPSLDVAETLTSAPNAVTVFPRLRPAADYRVTLQGVAVNCDVSDGNVRPVTVMADQTTSIAFDVVCHPHRLLAFVSDDDVYLVASNGTGRTRLTADAGKNREPAWSPDGQRIAFASDRDGNLELYSMKADGSDVKRLTVAPGDDDSPSWSPDGQRIVFQSTRDGNAEIYVANADGTGVVRLTNHPARDAQPSWSSTGKIAFVSDRDRSPGEIYIMDADGSNVTSLTFNTIPEVNPAWSPDGSMIAFAAQVECYYGCRSDIFVMNASGSNVRRLSTGWATYQDHREPSWSPNGQVVAFTRQYCDYYQCEAPAVWFAGLHGTQVGQITSSGGDPAWKP